MHLSFRRSDGSEWRTKKIQRTTFAIALLCALANALYCLAFPTFKYEAVNVPSSTSAKQRVEASGEATKALVRLPPGYDILDIGASSGASTFFLAKALAQQLGKHKQEVYEPRTLGMDINPKKVELCRSKGQDCVQGDILKLTSVEEQVNGVTLWHVLEHMPTCDLAESIWIKSSVVSRHFSSFRGPVFDSKEILQDKKTGIGFHRYYENWHGHTCHFNSTMLDKAIHSSDKTTAYIIAVMKPIISSASNVILPSGAQKDSHHYDPLVHPRKENVYFTETVYEEMRACALYEQDIQKHISLDSALALLDVIDGFMARSGIITHCESSVSSSKSDCAQTLRKLAIKAVQAATERDASELRKMAL